MAKEVKARVLVDCALGKVNSVVKLPEDELPHYAGQVDATPAAVAYAERLAKQAAAGETGE